MRHGYAIVKNAVSKAIHDGGLWLVYGNASVFQEAPSLLDMGPDAVPYRPPTALAVIDLLPTAMPDAWTKESEPKTTVAALYAELKAKRGRPWPPKLFLDSLNAALGQGFMHRASGNGPISSVQHDSNVDLMIRTESLKAQEPPPLTPAGRRASSLAVLNIGEVQDLAEQIHALAKPLAGMDAQIEVRITVKSKADGDLSEANNVLNKIKPGWKL